MFRLPEVGAGEELEHSAEQLERLAAEMSGGDAGPSDVTLDVQRRARPGNESRIRVTLVDAPRMPEARDVGTHAWPLNADAHWLVRLRVDELLTADAPFTVGAVAQFLVHSPTFFFHGGATVGSSYEFKVGWHQVDGGTARIDRLELDD